MQVAALALDSQVITSLPASEQDAWEAKQLRRKKAERVLPLSRTLPPLPSDINLDYD